MLQILGVYTANNLIFNPLIYCFVSDFRTFGYIQTNLQI